MSHMKRFIDAVRIYVRAGYGGTGHPKFDGVGGNGGNIYIKGVDGRMLSEIKEANPKQRWIGEHGKDSKKFRIIPSHGIDSFIPAPLGTIVTTDNKRIIGELNADGQTILVARGGLGGNQDNHFIGQPGEIQQINLNLKLGSDICLVGFETADHAGIFDKITSPESNVKNITESTEFEPHLSTLEYQDLRKIKIMKLPYLESRTVNNDMTPTFLKHAERTKILVLVIDVDGTKLKYRPKQNSTQNFLELLYELELCCPDLLDKPSVLLINHMDKPNSVNKLATLLYNLENLEDWLPTYISKYKPNRLMKFDEIIPCSINNINSLNYIKERLRTSLDIHTPSKLTDSETEHVLKDLKIQHHQKSVKLY